MNYLNDEVNEKSPAGFDWLISHIERIGRQNGTQLRVVWLPEVTKYLWGAIRRVYAFKKKSTHVGWEVGRMDDFNGGVIFVSEKVVPVTVYKRFNPDGAYRLSNGKWIKPIFEYDEIAHPRWGIEEMLDREREKPEHDAHRYEYFPDTNEFVDALGEYPRDGKWALIEVIAAHGYYCCKKATEEHRFCYGTKRNPTMADVDEIQKRIQGRDSRKRVTDYTSFASELRRLTRERMDSLKAGEARQKALYKEIIGEQTDAVFDMERRTRQLVTPVNRPAMGAVRHRLVDHNGRELPVE